MSSTPPFPELLSLVESRSAALRDAATDLTARVPGCPDWSVGELVSHLTRVQRFWTAAVTAADVTTPPPFPDPAPVAAPESPGPEAGVPAGGASGKEAAASARGLEEATRGLLDALREAGPEAPAWAWWPESAAPRTVGAIARHQVQEAAVHAFDAQEAAGRPEPLPAAVAVDGVPEFLSVCLGSAGSWPHRPARVEFQALEGPSWTVDLSPAGVIVGPAASGEPVTRFQGSASDLVLVLYRRIALEDVRVDGDREVAVQLTEWMIQD
ncbi:maleylpyruvate isomerase family mycothiol-dependent enzyme [Actinoplanes sp. DH11]|uniref:maleylpyruvate isomerase family mycothiol-dependent enzyme n=1 Tax=Actinoplanes sp. DH11 TaxID=2857011 RepID=UPI001E45C21E|nr:maleylpyruvate isomerase family mycothiol-dependent enzyme [Actinoplanes sp. DH11]